MTERLYYHDSALLEFEATITQAGEQDGRFITRLDRSAFYPTSGGQMHDTGKLNEVAVIDVQETPDGDVVHLSGQPVGEVGTVVQGAIDKERRQRHCYFHTGQHVLSHVFFSLFEMPTVSVHLGEEYGAVELDGAVPSADQLTRAEDRANELIREAHQVTIMFAEGEEKDSIPLRRPSKKPGRIRVVRIGDFEWAACGGTHCANTTELGLVKLIGVDKLRGHPLIKFLVGRPALEDYRSRFEVSTDVAQALSCHHRELPEKVSQLSAQNKELRKQLASLYRDVLPQQAAQIAAKAEAAGRNFVCAQSDLPDARLAGQLATLVAAEVGGVAMLLHESRLLIACADSSPHAAGDLAKKLAAEFSLKGGGSRSLAQLGGADPEKLAEYESFLLQAVEE